MVDTQVQNLTALTTASDDDVLYIVDDPAGTPLSRKITKANLLKALGTPESGVLTNCTGTPTLTLTNCTGLPLAGLATSAKTESFIIACSDETTALTAGTGKAEFQMPYAFTVTEVFATVTTAATGATLLTIDINEGGVSIISTKITLDASEKTSRTAATPPVISDSSLASSGVITIDIDAVGSTIAGAGLKVYIIGYQS